MTILVLRNQFFEYLRGICAEEMRAPGRGSFREIKDSLVVFVLRYDNLLFRISVQTRKINKPFVEWYSEYILPVTAAFRMQ